MKTRNILKHLSMLALSVFAFFFLAACDSGPSHGPKVGEEGEEPEAYGLQKEDLPGGEAKKTGNSADSEYNENEAMYPADKVQQNTGLEDDKPLELDGPLVLQQKKLMAMLNHQKTDLETEIRNLEAQPGNSENASTMAGNVEKMRSYAKKLDKEMAQVYGSNENNFEEVAETAQAAIEGAGALIASRNMRISESF